jgi:hypothetical protein
MPQGHPRFNPRVHPGRAAAASSSRTRWSGSQNEFPDGDARPSPVLGRPTHEPGSRPQLTSKAWKCSLSMNRPLSLPSPPLRAGERVAEGRERGLRFMVPMQALIKESRLCMNRIGARSSNSARKGRIARSWSFALLRFRPGIPFSRQLKPAPARDWTWPPSARLPSADVLRDPVGGAWPPNRSSRSGATRRRRGRCRRGNTRETERSP